ncbi:aminoacyl-tRNA hydrolase [Schlesneria sp. DSM 10557]|uniref:aminoacyl-tRNA hydrolase n=1 Tax=Schlesneria sp. DSM 10557 TaxID=3044399 RepID=UPI0035A02BF7
MKLVVGLGNPGSTYEGTRHNVGFDVIAELAHRWHADRSKLRFEAQLADGNYRGEKVLLAAPQTYMNLSGRSVQQIVKFYQIPLTDVLVVCDDMNLKLGQLRLRASGSAGGQKGLQSILDVCGTETVPRLRIGVGRPPEKMDAAAYVLTKFRKDEHTEVDASVRIAATGIELWIQEGITAAMNVVNSPMPDSDSNHSAGRSHP